MIEELSPEQIAKFPYYTKKWIDIGLSTEECDVEKAIEAINSAYKIVGLSEPKFVLGPVNNPFEGAIVEKIVKSFVGQKFKDNADFQSQVKKELDKILASGEIPKSLSIENQIYGNQEFWLSSYDFFEKECGIECCSKIDGLRKLAQVCGWWTPLRNVAIIQHRPLEIHRDDVMMIHNTNGPSIKYRGTDFCDVYAIHGVRVTKKIIEKDFTAEDITNEKNVEVRRVMMDIYTQEKYIQDCNAKIVASDDWGTLYQINLIGDEPLMMVKVVNSSQEPDGTFKDYFIRVDPKCYGGLKTGLEAVASTWRNEDGSLVFENASDYDPMIQT